MSTTNGTIASLLHVSKTCGAMNRKRRDGHGIRIGDALWAAMEERAAATRRTRTAWALDVLDAACRGALIPLPRQVTERLDYWAHREGVSREHLGLSFVEWGINEKEARRRRRTTQWKQPPPRRTR